MEGGPGRPSGSPEYGQLDVLIPPVERRAPIVTVHDAASHALAWLGSVFGAKVTSLGVDDFGQSGSRSDLYHHFGLDAEQIAAAAFECNRLIAQRFAADGAGMYSRAYMVLKPRRLLHTSDNSITQPIQYLVAYTTCPSQGAAQRSAIQPDTAPALSVLG